MPGHESALDYLEGRLRERITAVESGLSDGGCKDYAEYRARCGLIQGLKEALRDVREAHRRVDQD